MAIIGTQRLTPLNQISHLTLKLKLVEQKIQVEYTASFMQNEALLLLIEEENCS